MRQSDAKRLSIVFFNLLTLFYTTSCTDSGCLDGTTEAFQDEESLNVAGCTGEWQGHIKNGSVLCAVGWRVCSWHHQDQLSSIPYTSARTVSGCYAYNAAQNNGRCKACINKKDQDNLAGVGFGCMHQGSEGLSCLKGGGPIHASCCDEYKSEKACNFKPGIATGVLCCRLPTEPPHIVVRPRVMTHVLTGVTFVLSCQAGGTPTPQVTWTKNGQLLTMDDPRVAVFDSGYLLISEAQVSDSGHYWCSVKNSAGSDKALARVTVTDHGSGCADGTTDALHQYEDIQGCQGRWNGHVKRGKSLCARGWQVCSPRHNNVIKLLTWQDVSETKGCYAYNAANTLNRCSRCHTQGSDMAGIGGECGRVRKGYQSCLAQGRIDVYKSRLTAGCSYKKSITTGVMCCKRKSQAGLSLYSKPQCQPKCSNGGRCVGGNRCQCLKGYKGAWCQNPICNGGCIPNSTCIKPNTCRCRPGHVGSKCKPKITNHCKPACLNGGRCHNGRCKCPKGWIGSSCHHTLETKRWHISSDLNRTE